MAFPHDGNKFQPGKTGNPNGRPKKLPDLDLLLAEVLGVGSDGIEEASLILEALRKEAKKGDVRAAEMLFDRAYGKAKQTLAVNHSGTILNGFRQKENQPILNGNGVQH